LALGAVPLSIGGLFVLATQEVLMGRVTSLRKKRLQHKLDREVHKAKRAVQRRRNPKPVKRGQEDVADRAIVSYR
jgi:hypothetical protein